MEWQPHGSVGGTISNETPDGAQYLVIPNCETAEWEVYVSRNGGLFTRLDDRSWHTKEQARTWAEGDAD